MRVAIFIHLSAHFWVGLAWTKSGHSSHLHGGSQESIPKVSLGYVLVVWNVVAIWHGFIGVRALAHKLGKGLKYINMAGYRVPL